MNETTRWESAGWTCPECGGVIEPLAEKTPTVRCLMCDREFRVQFEERTASEK